MTTLDTVTVRVLLRQLRTLGVVLTPLSDGRIRYRAPKRTMTPALLTIIRQHKMELHALAADWCARVALAAYCAGLSRLQAEQVAWQCLLEEAPHAGCAACRLTGGE